MTWNPCHGCQMGRVCPLFVAHSEDAIDHKFSCDIAFLSVEGCNVLKMVRT